LDLTGYNLHKSKLTRYFGVIIKTLNDMEKETTITWQGLKVDVHYEPNGMPDLILLNVICYDNPIEFLEKVQGNENALDEIATIVGEDWAAENYVSEPDIDYLYERSVDK